MNCWKEDNFEDISPIIIRKEIELEIETFSLISDLYHQILTVFAMEGGGMGTLCPRQILLFVVGASGILRNRNFQRIPKIH